MRLKLFIKLERGLSRLAAGFLYFLFLNQPNCQEKNITIMGITYMTKEGYKKKMEEIAYLENVKRPEISRAIA